MNLPNSLPRFLRCAIWCVVITGVFSPFVLAGELKLFDARSLDQVRQAHKGKPFILAFWSLHCAPCKEEMATLKSIHARYPKFPIVLVSTDTPGEREMVVRFLSQQALGRIELWVFADEFEERIRYRVDRDWRGELPRTYLFDSDHRATGQSGILDRKVLDGWLSRAAQQPP